MAKYQKLTIPIASEDMKQHKILFIVDGNTNGRPS